MRKSLFAAFLSIALFSIANQSHAQALINYWNFNNFTATDTFGSAKHPIPLIKADYSVIDTNKAYMLYTFDSGTSVKSMDSCWIDGSNPGAILNAQHGAPAGNFLRVRNPTDFTQLWFFIPTTNFKNITVSYALESSSVKSGPEVMVFAYSVDSGLHWKTSSLTVNGANVDTIKDTASVYQGTSFGLVTIGFGNDTTVNNNSKLVLSMSFKKDDTGAVAGISGNDRIDNVAVIGSYLTSNITVVAPPAGDTLFAGLPDTVIYQTAGLISSVRAVYLSTDSGDSWNELGISTKDTFVWVVPNHASSNCFIEVIDTVNGIIGKSPRFIIHVPRISVSAPPAGDTLLVGQQALIKYALYGAVSGFRSINYSYDSGKSWSFVDESVQDTFTWTVPNTPSNNCFIQVKDQNGIVGLSGRFLILTMKPPPPPPPPAGGLIHYWNFNTLAGPYIHPNIPPIVADYTVLTPDSAYLEYYLWPGTSASWASNNNMGGAQINNTTSNDSTNLRLGAASGLCLRYLNPTDSSELRWHIPSTGYTNLVVKFATLTSSVGSGDSAQDYSYSVDGGKTWDSTSMTVNSASGHTVDLTQGGNANSIYLNYVLVTITFGSDTTVNNNPNLIFRIKCYGNTSKTSGNNRFDDFTLDGVVLGSVKPPPPVPDSIAVSAPAVGDSLLAGTQTTISYSVTATTGKSRSIDYSTNGGTTWINVATGDTALTYNWIVPATPSSNALVRVKDSIGVIGMSSPFVILVPGTVDSVWLSPSPVLAGASTNILWKATGYLGNTLAINAYYDGVTPNLIESGPSEANGSYAWTVPDADVNGVFVRVTFASGATGQSAPFNIVSPASVSEGSNGLANIELWPNPFQTQTTIQYELTSSENVTLSIHDIVGREVESIPQGMQSAGVHEITFDGSHEPEGVYLYELTVGDARYRGQLVIIR
jgi:hypothetical protein